MSRSHRILTAVIAAALALGTLTALGANASADAATSCTDADPAPVIEDISNIDAAPGARSRGMDVQSLSAMTDNRCARGGSYDCSLSTSCTNARFSLRRSSATTVAARRCAHTRTTEDDGQGLGPFTEPTTTRPTVYTVVLHWTIAYDDGPQPAMHNACAGAWDLTAVVTNTYEVDGQTRSRSSEPFTRTRAFFVRRESRVTADAGPARVRRRRHGDHPRAADPGELGHPPLGRLRGAAGEAPASPSRQHLLPHDPHAAHRPLRPAPHARPCDVGGQLLPMALRADDDRYLCGLGRRLRAHAALSPVRRCGSRSARRTRRARP